MSALSVGPRVWKPSRSTLQLVNPNEALTISTLPITSRVPHNGWLKENDSARRPRKCYSPPRRKSDAITFTIEEEREGKKILMSDPRFKLLFVPGYEVEEPDYLYVDPVPEDSPIEVLDQYIRGKYKGDDFIKRFIELRRLEEDTVYWEERQERADVSSNNISPSSGEGYDRSVRILRGDKTVISKTPKTYSPYLSGSKLLSVEKDAKISRAKSAPAIKSTHTQSSGKEFNNYCNTCKLAWKHNHRKKRTKSAKAISGKLKPTKYYDIVDIAETFEVPCQEKIKSKAREFPLSARNSSILPGKSFTSQRKDSLTNLKRRRPKTGVKTKSSNKTKRPVTANPVTRRKAKVS